MRAAAKREDDRRLERVASREGEVEGPRLALGRVCAWRHSLPQSRTLPHAASAKCHPA